MPELGSLCFLFLLPSFFPPSASEAAQLLFLLSWDNAHPFRGEIQVSAAATAGAHKSSQKPPKSPCSWGSSQVIGSFGQGLV